MTNACLKAADLTANQLLDLVKSLGPGDATNPRRVWLEAADGWAFDWWRGLDDGTLNWCGTGRESAEAQAGDCLSRSTTGRLFAPNGELRWRVIPALGAVCWRTMFLGNSDWVGAAMKDCSEHLQGLEPEREGYFLWGQQTAATPGKWIELRIPHRFCYPVHGNPRHVIVLVEQWRDEVGEPRFLRLCDLEPALEAADA